jgi:hypothetical protein
MTWRAETECILALTRAVGEALDRGDREAARLLLEERGIHVRRLAQLGDDAQEPALGATLGEIRAAESALAARLARDAHAAAAALGRTRAAPRFPVPAGRYDRQA